MKVELDDITIGISAITDEVFVGVTQKGKHNEWKHKKNITNEFLSAAIQKWNGYVENITSSNGKTYEISIKEVENENKSQQRRP